MESKESPVTQGALSPMDRGETGSPDCDTKQVSVTRGA